MKKVILQVENVSKNYRSPNGLLKVLKGIHLDVKEGEMLMILGRSGSGKSTLLHLLGGLDRANEGSIQYRGKELSRFSDNEMSEYRLKKVGFVFQFYYLLPELTLFENVALPGQISGTVRKKQINDLIERVGLSERRHHYPSQLSGGEQQRAAIARALSNDPDVVFCDEPTGNLDEETAASVFDLLVSLNREDKKTFVIVTHEMSLVKKATAVYELREGILNRS